jgi:hypothetical protein
MSTTKDRRQGTTKGTNKTPLAKGKENGRKPRYQVVVGKDFDDLRELSRWEVWRGRIGRFLRWAGGAFLASMLAKLGALLVERFFG